MPGTIAADQVSYVDLYSRWEHGNWRATEIDFARDREQWHGELTDIDRSSALWTPENTFPDRLRAPPGLD